MEAVKETVSGASSAPEAQHASGAPPVSQVTGEMLLTVPSLRSTSKEALGRKLRRCCQMLGFA